MSGRDHLGGERSEADEVYLPGERYQPHPRINWRAEIIPVVITFTIVTVLHITGLYEVMQRYVPNWIFGPVFIALGLFVILRPGAVANTSRSGAILNGGFIVLIGALIAFSYA